MKRNSLALATILCSLIFGCNGSGSSHEQADLILLGGNLHTMDPDRPSATALAIRADRILAVGSDAEIRKLQSSSTEVIDLAGRTVMPGFIEGHGHFAGLGTSLDQLDLRDLGTWDEIVSAVAEVAKTLPEGEWILGRGWHQDKWDRPPSPTVDGYPVHGSLSAVTPNHPVLLVHASGHASMVNAKALELAGIDRATPDPPGGTILRDRSGNATGTLRENAERLANDAVGRWEASLEASDRLAQWKRRIDLAEEECLKHGVTSFQDAGSSLEAVDQFLELAQDGDLAVRLWVMLTDNNSVLAERAAEYAAIRGVGAQHLTVGGIKRWLDGALGAHGAWLLEPYSDLPGSTGLNTLPLEELRETAALAAEHHLQLCVHAIGDRANRETLDLYEETFDRNPNREDWRWRIEHAQHLSSDDIGRFAELDVIASMQSVHCTSDGPWVPTRLGDRRSEEGAYVWRALLDSGATVINGTDVPVERLDPIANFYAAVTRRMKNGNSFYAEQAMTRDEALRSATIDAAYAAFEDEIKGSLTPGKLADIAVLSQDLWTVDEDRILDTRVVYTLVGGRVVYAADSPKGAP